MVVIHMILKFYSTHNEGKSVVAKRIIRTFEKSNLEICDFNIK